MEIPKFVQPDEVNRGLQHVSLYLTAWETLRSSVIDHVKGFYSDNWTIDGRGNLKGEVGAEYKEKVISLHPKDELHACTLWLQNLGAFDEADIEMINSARRHRNSISHEIRDYITRNDTNVDREALFGIYNVVKKLDVWWLCEIELATRDDVTEEMEESARKGEAWGGYSVLLELILPVFDGDFSSLANLHKSLQQQAEQGVGADAEPAV